MTGGDTQLRRARQVFNADGSKAGGEFLVNQTTVSNQQIHPVVTGPGRRRLCRRLGG